MWLDLNNKVLTWDNLYKMNKSGPSHISLFKVNNETTLHLLISYFLLIYGLYLGGDRTCQETIKCMEW